MELISSLGHPQLYSFREDMVNKVIGTSHAIAVAFS